MIFALLNQINPLPIPERAPRPRGQFAKAWALKITGGGELRRYSPTSPELFRTVFSQVSVTDFGGRKGVTGQVQRYAVNYNGTTNLRFHGAVDKLLIGQDGGNTIVNICGTITAVQEEGRRELTVGDRFGMAFTDVPDGPDCDRFPPTASEDQSIV